VDGTINVAIVGVGNNASALMQGWAKETEEGGSDRRPVAGYQVRDFRFVCAFDVSERKVGSDIASAIFAEPTNFPAIYPVRELGVTVLAGPRLDALSDDLASIVPLHPTHKSLGVDEVASELRTSDAHVVVNFLPSGSPEAAKFYATAAASAGCAYINATPDPVVHDASMVTLFERAGVPLLGDDLESQMGATVMHRAILQTLVSKGLTITGSYQMNVGGNMDFRNLTIRGDAKKRSKRRGLMIPDAQRDIHVLPAAAYFPFLGDRKVAHITVETEGWLGSRNVIEVRLEIQDSSSAASVVADLIRIAKYELDAGRSGLVEEAGFYFKSPSTKKEMFEAESLLSRYQL
jgi:myo-inositol-1-phosphate synthase